MVRRLQQRRPVRDRRRRIVTGADRGDRPPPPVGVFCVGNRDAGVGHRNIQFGEQFRLDSRAEMQRRDDVRRNRIPVAGRGIGADCIAPVVRDLGLLRGSDSGSRRAQGRDRRSRLPE